VKLENPPGQLNGWGGPLTPVEQAESNAALVARAGCTGVRGA